MFRCSLVLRGRPKGPPGLCPGKEFRLTVPYRSEVTMLRQCNFKKFNSNIRELFKRPLVQNNIKAIPRDLGELPRNYVVKLLFFHQPIRLIDLWEVCKQHDDVPLDSAKHLRLVLKIAKLQKWVYAEKNQSNNLYYYYIDQSRTHEVRDMVRQDEIARKQREADAEVAVEREKEEKHRTDMMSLDSSIAAMQNLLVSNLAQIRSFDPDYVADKPYVTETGAINCIWHWDGISGKQTRSTEGEEGEENGDRHEEEGIKIRGSATTAKY